MGTATPSVTPAVETSEVLDYRHYGTLEEIYARELIRLAGSTGGNCYALTGDAGYAPDGRSIYLLATTNGDPALTTGETTSWAVGLYDTQGDSVALAMGEASVDALGDSPDALGCAITRARTALHQYTGGGAPAGKVALIGDQGVTWIPA